MHYLPKMAEIRREEGALQWQLFQIQMTVYLFVCVIKEKKKLHEENTVT